MKGALVIGGHVQGLGIIRSLGMNGIPVILMDTTSYNIARFSNYCSKFIVAPRSIFGSEQSFSRFLIDICHQYNLKDWLIFPTDDQTVAFLSRQKNILSRYYKIWTPSWDVTIWCYNKRKTYSMAKNAEIPHPITYSLKNICELGNVSKNISFPVLIKPAVRHKFYEASHAQFFIANDYDELFSYYNEARHIINDDEILIQELIPCSASDNIEVGLFFSHGQIIKSITIKKLRQIPINGGTGTSYQIVPDRPELLNYCQRFLSSIGYYGICNLEFIWDRRDKSYKLIDVNPRTFKWHYISLFAGFNLPYMLYCDIYGLSSSSHSNERLSGVIRYYDELPDFYIACYEVLKRKSTIRDYIESVKGARRYAVASWKDPLPFIAGAVMAPFILWDRRVN